MAWAACCTIGRVTGRPVVAAVMAGAFGGFIDGLIAWG